MPVRYCAVAVVRFMDLGFSNSPTLSRFSSLGLTSVPQYELMAAGKERLFKQESRNECPFHYIGPILLFRRSQQTVAALETSLKNRMT